MENREIVVRSILVMINSIKKFDWNQKAQGIFFYALFIREEIQKTAILLKSPLALYLMSLYTESTQLPILFKTQNSSIMSEPVICKDDNLTYLPSTLSILSCLWKLT